VKIKARLRALLVLGVLVAATLMGATAVVLAKIVRDGKPVALPRPALVQALAFTPSGDLLLDLEGERRDGSGAIVAWAEPTGTLVGVIAKNDKSPTDIAVSTSNVLAVAHEFGEIALRSLPKGEDMGEPLPGGGWSVGSNIGIWSGVGFSRSGDRVAANGVHRSLSIWNVGARQKLNPAKKTDNPVYVPETIFDCRQFLGFVSEDTVAYAASGSLHLWSIDRQMVTAELLTESPGPPVHFLSPRGSLWASYPWKEGTVLSPVSIRALPSGKRVGAPIVVEVHDRIAFSPDDDLVAVAGDHRVFIQEVATGGVVFSAPFPDATDPHVRSLAFSPTRDRLAVARGTTIFVFPFRRW
jgi:WD40 repeat protein